MWISWSHESAQMGEIWLSAMSQNIHRTRCFEFPQATAMKPKRCFPRAGRYSISTRLTRRLANLYMPEVRCPPLCLYQHNSLAIGFLRNTQFGPLLLAPLIFQHTTKPAGKKISRSNKCIQPNASDFHAAALNSRKKNLGKPGDMLCPGSANPTGPRKLRRSRPARIPDTDFLLFSASCRYLKTP